MRVSLLSSVHYVSSQRKKKEKETGPEGLAKGRVQWSWWLARHGSASQLSYMIQAVEGAK